MSDGDQVLVAGRAHQGTLYADAIRNAATGITVHGGIITRIIVAVVLSLIGLVTGFVFMQGYGIIVGLICFGTLAGAAYQSWRASQTSNALHYVKSAVP